MEQAENDFLSGSDNRLFTQRLSALLTGRDPRGGNIVLTINRRAQEAAVRRWATGAARWSRWTRGPARSWPWRARPSYDPNLLSSHDPSRIRAEYNELADDPADPLLNRAINQRYPPGSTFKVVTSAAALANGRTPDTLIDCPREYVPPQTTRPLNNFGDEACSAPRVTLQQALTISYNTAFAKLGMEVGESEHPAGMPTGVRHRRRPARGAAAGVAQLGRRDGRPAGGGAVRDRAAGRRADPAAGRHDRRPRWPTTAC